MNEFELEYFKEVISFFEEFQWLYGMPVTKILCKGSLDSLPADWSAVLDHMENDELNDFATEFKIKDDWPKSLIDFVANCRKFNKLPGSNVSLSSTPSQLPDSFLKKLSLKKQHEIFHLSRLVHEQCQRREISLVIDLGCGLGYICQLLNHLYGYAVLGLESNPSNVRAAKVWQESEFPDSLASVKYVCCNVSEDSLSCIESIVQREFGDAKNICLMGLHACGDLSVYMSRIFVEMKNAQLLVLVSCCYHKMNLKDSIDVRDGIECFNHFPLSKTLRDAVDGVNVDVGRFFNRPFLRLACQETSDRWLEMSKKTHEEHSFHVLARAVLELYAVQNGLSLKKLVRKATRKSQCTNFETYLRDCAKRYAFEKEKSGNSITWNERVNADLTELWEKNSARAKSIESYSALQLLLQHAAESVVLQDRLHFLREHNFKADIVQISNRRLSPRSHAIVSNKK